MLTWLCNFLPRRRVETTVEDWVDFLFAGGYIRPREWQRLDRDAKQMLATAGRLYQWERDHPEAAAGQIAGDARTAVPILEALMPGGRR